LYCVTSKAPVTVCYFEKVLTYWKLSCSTGKAPRFVTLKPELMKVVLLCYCKRTRGNVTMVTSWEIMVLTKLWTYQYNFHLVKIKHLRKTCKKYQCLNCYGQKWAVRKHFLASTCFGPQIKIELYFCWWLSFVKLTCIFNNIEQLISNFKKWVEECYISVNSALNL